MELEKPRRLLLLQRVWLRRDIGLWSSILMLVCGNLDLIMGVERRVVFDFVSVISGEATLNQALIQDKRLEKFVDPGSQSNQR